MDSTLLVRIVSAVAGFLAIATTVTLWLLSRKKKGLGWEVLVTAPLVESSAVRKLEISFDGKVVEEPHLVRVRICNAERGTIERADFRAPIKVTFGKADIFPISEPKCAPALLAPVLNWTTPHTVLIEPLDLNPGAEIHFTALVSKQIEEKDVTCETLIHGGVNKGDARRLAVGPPVVVLWLAVILCLSLLIGMIVVFVVALINAGAQKALATLGIAAAVVGGLFVLVLGVALADRKIWPDYLR